MSKCLSGRCLINLLYITSCSFLKKQKYLWNGSNVRRKISKGDKIYIHYREAILLYRAILYSRMWIFISISDELSKALYYNGHDQITSSTIYRHAQDEGRRPFSHYFVIYWTQIGKMKLFNQCQHLSVDVPILNCFVWPWILKFTYFIIKLINRAFMFKFDDMR